MDLDAIEESREQKKLLKAHWRRSVCSAGSLTRRTRRGDGGSGGNPDVRMTQVEGKDELILRPLDQLPEPDSLVRLREAVHARSPRVDLPELLREIASRTYFTAQFTHVNARESHMQYLSTSVCPSSSRRHAIRPRSADAE